LGETWLPTYTHTQVARFRPGIVITPLNVMLRNPIYAVSDNQSRVKTRRDSRQDQSFFVVRANLNGG